MLVLGQQRCEKYLTQIVVLSSAEYKTPVLLLIFENFPTGFSLLQPVLLLILDIFPIGSYIYLVKSRFYYLFSDFFPPVRPYYNWYYY